MTAIDEGLLSPVTAGRDELVSDAAVLDALVTAEVALVQAYGTIGVAPASAVAGIEGALGATRIDVTALAEAAVAGGNPVIPLVGLLKAEVVPGDRVWIHRGATSQDILDTALMLVSRAAVARVRASLGEAEAALVRFAADHRDDVGAARTLTQHAVPTTIGLRAVGWMQGVRRAATRLDAVAEALPLQLGGAGGTLASFVDIVGSPDGAVALVRAYAGATGLALPDSPWHVSRWPVTELGDALVQAIDAVGRIAADVATLSRTEIGELSEGAGGGSSAMPQKQNPAESVLIRSAAIRAPQLGATLHLASALAVDERPDGAWHAEWPTLRELLRLALGASAYAVSLVSGLRVDAAAVARNLALSRGLIVAERLSIVLGPLLGKDAVAGIVAAAGKGEPLSDVVRAAIAGTDAAGLDVDALLDPAGYTGLAARLVDGALSAERDGES